MAASRKSPADATGRKAEELAEARAKELAERAQELTLLNPLPEVVDYTEPKPEEPQKPLESGIVSSSNVQVKGGRKVRLRVNTDLEECTIGRGNNYTFRRDQTYLVPLNVYEHLERLGYVWH
ncbi:hypothetical protein [Nonomuraea typhae]|uniref:Uncharacterized protein n=1 Tax=Nonomuraea typhae TaxID=2603600 RepID=A0ABW7YKL7_9ACTN